MARIPADQLDRLKVEVAVQRLAEAAGIQLKHHGADLLGLCPFHDDHEPSLVISPQKNLWHCLGACQTGGSVIDWVMKSEGVSFRHAVELLQADYQPLAAEPVKVGTTRKLDNPLPNDAKDQRLLNQVIEYYHESLKQSPEALAYLEKRGIGDREAIDRFQLGFANRTLGYRLPLKNRTAGAAIRGQLQRIGLLRSSGHEHFNGSLVIPVRDAEGNVTEVYGRKINDNLRKGTPTHLYLPGPHQGVWNRDALTTSKEVIVCESLIDALTFWCAGFKNVTASYGIEGFTADHRQAFKDHGTERVLIAYDRDAAGGQAADKLSKQLMQAGIECYRIQFPKSMDANEYACKVGPANKSLGVVIRSATWLGKGEAPVSAESEPAAKEETPVDESESISSLAADPAPESKEAEPVVDASEPLPASPVPSVPKLDIPAKVSDDEVVMTLGDRRYRIRGLPRNISGYQLKVNVLVTCGEALHVDTFDLYADRPRGLYVRHAASELGVKEDVIKRDLGKVLLKLEALQEERRKAEAQSDDTVTIDEEDRAKALALLKSPDLLEQILIDFDRCGVVGEETNKLIGYLAAVSRKLDKPLAVMVQSSSAAGKSSLMDAVLAFVPEEDRVQYSAMTGQSLFYMDELELQHKILAIAEESGANDAAYALKLLQSEGTLTIASTGKDPQTGELRTKPYHVEGPVMLFSTTTAIDLDEELLNRCIALSVNESREQTRAIQARQRFDETLEGLLAGQTRDDITHVHRNAQRLLKPLKVVNPYAEHLTFVDDKTRTRRDHKKYLTLIRVIALLHQYQRRIKTTQHQDKVIEYVEVTLDDIKTANRLAHEVLGRTLDELPPQTRRLLGLIDAMVTARCASLDMARTDYRFSRREIREQTHWSDTALKVHLARLAEMEYLLVHRGGRGQSYVYELLYQGEGEQGESFLMGLIDVEALRKQHGIDTPHDSVTAPCVANAPTVGALPPASMQSYDEKKSGQNGHRSEISQPPVRGQSGGGQGSEKADKSRQGKLLADIDEETAESALLRTKKTPPSYRTHSTPALHAKAAR